MATTRIVLPEHISEKDVDAAAWNHHWSLVRTIKADADTPHEVVWYDATQDVAIHYIEDFFIDCTYLVLQGEAFDTVIEDIYASLPQAHTTADIFRTHDLAEHDASEHLARSIHHLGLIAPSAFEPLFFDRLHRTLTHPDSNIRSATITAIAYTGWVEFKPHLESLCQSESDPHVRKDIEILLSGFNQRDHEKP
jgi:hypothetical protein